MQKKRKSSYHHGDLRRALIAESTAMIRKHGVEALNLRVLAKRLKVSSGAPYHHFASRSALLDAIAQEGFELLQQGMVSSRDTAKGAGQRLQAIGMAYVQFAVSHPGHFRVMFRAEVRASNEPALSKASENSFGLLCQVIEECQRDGEAPQVDPKLLALTAWSLVHGVATLWVDGALPSKPVEIDPIQMAPMVSGLMVRMFAAVAHEKA
jgi:AcrR family transcriptional regulator